MRTRTALATLSLSFVLFGVHAETLQGNTRLELVHDLCKADAHTAELIMGFRQSGTPMAELMSAVLEVSKGSQTRAEQVSAVERAYAIPSFRGETAQKQAVTDFGNAKYAECFISYK